MINLVRISISLFQVVSQKPIGDTESREVAEFIQSIGNCPRPLVQNFDFPAIRELISVQPKIPAIRRKWAPVFSQSRGITEAQATKFIRRILNASESVEKILDYGYYAGLTTTSAQQWNDIHTYRPFLKQGWTLHLTSAGMGYYNCLRNRLETRPGDFILLSPAALFNFQRSKQVDHWNHHWLIFPAEPEWLNLLRWTEIGAGIYHTCVDNDAQRSNIIALFEEIRQLSADVDPSSRRLRRNLTEQILIRCYEKHKYSNPTVVDDRISNAIRFLEGNFHMEVSVDDIAKHAHLSNSQLTKLFRRFTGITPIKWRDERRMAQASQMLTHSLDPINIVAEKAGYQDPAYFSRCFHRQFHCSPKQYREKYLNDAGT